MVGEKKNVAGGVGALKSQWLWGAVRADSALSLENGGAKLGRAEDCAEQRMMVPLSTGALPTETERREVSGQLPSNWKRRPSAECNASSSECSNGHQDNRHYYRPSAIKLRSEMKVPAFKSLVV